MSTDLYILLSNMKNGNKVSEIQATAILNCILSAFERALRVFRNQTQQLKIRLPKAKIVNNELLAK